MALISRKVLERRPQLIGRIKIGGKGEERTSKKGKKFRQPEKYEYFKVTTMERGPDENFIKDEAIHSHKSVGDKPRELYGVLMYDTPEENFHSELSVYEGRTKKVSSCNGEVVTNLKSGEESTCRQLAGQECPCKPYSRLHLQLWASPHILGYHVFRTTSWESTNNIQTALEDIYGLFGSCFQAPVKLYMYPSEDVHDGGVSTSWKVSLVLAMGLEEVADRMQKSARILGETKGRVKQLAAGVMEELEVDDEEDLPHFVDEYHPDVAHTDHVTSALYADGEDEEPDDVQDAVVVEGVADGEPEKKEDHEDEDPDEDEGFLPDLEGDEPPEL